MAGQGYYNGQTATNKATGERVMYQNGQWVPMPAQGAGGPVPIMTPDAQKAIGDARTASTAATAAIPQLERFMSLNKQQATGPAFSGLKLPNWLGGAELNPGAGITKMINPDAGSKLEQMQEITANLIPSRHITPGPMTDADARMYERSLPSVSKYGTSNQPNVDMMKAAQANAGDYLAFLEDWAKKHGGSINGAAEQWMAYSNANPIWQGDQLNQARLPWRDYFAATGQAMPAPQRIRIDAQGNPIQ